MKKLLWLGACVLLAACGGTSVTGTVVVQGAADNSGVLVTLAGKEAQSVITQADGKFVFDKSDEGAYALTLEAGDTLEGRRFLALSLKDGQGGDVGTLELTASSTLTGKATLGGDTGNAGITVSVVGGGGTTTTADDGSFVLRNVPAGERTVVASREGYAPQVTHMTIMRGQQAFNTVTLQREPPAPGQVSGLLTYFRPQPANTITITARGLPDFSAHPDSAGRYTLSLPTGRWELLASASGYPTQTFATVNVTAGGVVQPPAAVLSSYIRFNSPGDLLSYNTPQARLLEDGKHALVTYNGYENARHHLVNLETGDEKMVVMEWNFMSVDQLVASRTGRGVVLPDYTGFMLFDTSTGRLTTYRSPGGESFNMSTAGFTTDESVFVAYNGKHLVRVTLATGVVEEVEADVAAYRVDENNWVGLDRTTSGNPTGTAVSVSNAATQQLLSDVYVDNNKLQQGKYLLVQTGCSAGVCNVNIIDGVAHQTRATTGGQWKSTVVPGSTNHTDWARLEDSSTPRNAYVKLTDGTVSNYPAGYSTAMAAAAKLNKTGTRIAFTSGTSPSISMHETAMPPAAIPASVGTPTSTWSYAWLSPTRLVAVGGGGAQLVDVRNGDAAPVLDYVASSAHLTSTAASWRRASDKALVAVQHDSPVFTLRDDPKQEYVIGDQTSTLEDVWTFWTVYRSSNSEYDFLARAAAGGPLKTWQNMHFDSDFPSSKTGVSVYGSFAGTLDETLDLETGVRRLIYEDDMSSYTPSLTTYTQRASLRTSHFTGRQVSINGSTYNVTQAGLLLY